LENGRIQFLASRGGLKLSSKEGETGGRKSIASWITHACVRNNRNCSCKEA